MKYVVVVGLIGLHSCSGVERLESKVNVDSYEECTQKAQEWSSLPFVYRTSCETFKSD